MIARETTITARVRVLATAGAFVLAGTWISAAWAGGIQLVPETKLRVSVIQWMPPKGAYERWDALGGEFVVSQAGTLTLPVIGTIPIDGQDGASLAADVASRIQAKLVLVDKPEVTVDVLEYPPVYVVGDVAKPGEYKFREGMTVLQALALSGGELRASTEKSREEIELVGELQGVDADIVRSTAKIARLEAEMSGASEIRFPTVSPDDAIARDAFAQERIIFDARANEIKRQTTSLGELRQLLNAEIDVLKEKIKAADASIKMAEDELAGVKTLVEKGIAVASRKSDLERALSSYRTDRLDQVTAAMRAQQAITEATRNADGLLDRQKTEVATSLQAEQASIGKLKLKREVAQKLLLDSLASASRPVRRQEDSAPTFAITRIQGGVPSQISGAASTTLMPGDVISVAFAGPPKADPQTETHSGPKAADAASN